MIKIWLLVLTMILCGANQGCNQTNLSTAVIQMYSQDPDVISFNPQNSTIQSLLSVAPLIGSMLGAISTTYFLSKFKRKYVMISASITGVVLNSFMFIPWCWEYIFVAKITTGFPTGMISTITPGWLAELANVRQRGVVSVINEPSVCLGYVMNSLMLLAIGESSQYWRLSFVPAIFCCTCEIICCSLLSEKLSEPQSGSESDVVQTSFTWKQFFSVKHYKSVVISFLLPFAQQGTGKNAIVTYSTKIFENVFSNVPQMYSSIYGSMLVSSCCLVFSLCSMAFINRLGRKPLLFGGFTTCQIGLVIYMICYIINNSSPSEAALIVASFIFFIGYENGPGPVFYAITGEIYPLYVKPKASGVNFCIKNATNLVATLVFPYFSNFYWVLYLVFLVISLTPTWIMFPIIPETKNKKLSEISELMVKTDNELLKENIAIVEEAEYK